MLVAGWTGGLVSVRVVFIASGVAIFDTAMTRRVGPRGESSLYGGSPLHAATGGIVATACLPLMYFSEKSFQNLRSFIA